MARRMNFSLDRAQHGLMQALLMGLAGLIAFQLAALVWAVSGPIGPFGAIRVSPVRAGTPSTDWAVFSRFDPFFRTLGPSGPVIAQPGADLGLTLFAIRRQANGEGGSAIVATADGRQISVQVGEEAAPGLVLHAVHEDSAVFQRGGALLELKFPPSAAASVLRPAEPAELAAPAPAAALPVSYQVDPRSFFNSVRLAPVRDGERVLGYRIGPESSQQPVMEAGLQKGDVLLSVNGVSLSTAASLQAAANSLAGRSDAVITYDRAGKSGSVNVRVAKP